MHAYTCACIHMDMYIHIRAHVQACTRYVLEYTYTCLYTHIHDLCTYIDIHHTYIHICTHVLVYIYTWFVYIYIDMHIPVYIHTHTHTPLQGVVLPVLISLPLHGPIYIYLYTYIHTYTYAGDRASPPDFPAHRRFTRLVLVRSFRAIMDSFRPRSSRHFVCTVPAVRAI
jgi:hypothetical protein